jgi:hypothetical protein
MPDICNNRCEALLPALGSWIIYVFAGFPGWSMNVAVSLNARHETFTSLPEVFSVPGAGVLSLMRVAHRSRLAYGLHLQWCSQVTSQVDLICKSTSQISS